jgi:hypothetical protein
MPVVSNCAPSVKKANISCFTHRELQEIAKGFNRYIVKKDLCYNDVCGMRMPIEHIYTMSPEGLWQRIRQRLYKICGDRDDCWVKLPFIKLVADTTLQKKLKHYTFKPSGTRGKYTWLTTTHIDGVLGQYAMKHPDFHYMGAQPCDFYTFIDVDYDSLKQYDKVGIVLNLDKDDQPGSHWVAMFIDNKGRTLEFFDSVGGPPNACIRRFIRKLLKHHLRDHVYLQNDIVHQRENSECGVYSIYYIIQRLRGRTFRDITRSVVDDTKMNKYRNRIFLRSN